MASRNAKFLRNRGLAGGRLRYNVHMPIYRRVPAQPEKVDGAASPPVDAGREQLTAGPRRRWPAAIAGLALLISACGSTSTTESVSSGGADDDTGTSIADSSDDQSSDDEPVNGADDGDGAGEDGKSTPASESESVTEGAVPAVNVPAVEVLDIADGSVINLADELAGEDRAILFWFWAPH